MPEYPCSESFLKICLYQNHAFTFRQLFHKVNMKEIFNFLIGTVQIKIDGKFLYTDNTGTSLQTQFEKKHFLLKISLK